MTRGRSRRPARTDDPAVVEGRVVRAVDEGRVDEAVPGLGVGAGFAAAAGAPLAAVVLTVTGSDAFDDGGADGVGRSGVRSTRI